MADDDTGVGDDGAPTEQKPRSPWIWVSAALAVAFVGLLVWALDTRSDRDAAEKESSAAQEQAASAQKELDTTQQELESIEQDAQEDAQEGEADVNEPDKTGRRAVLTAGTLATMKKLYDDLAAELGATEEDLASAEEEISDADEEAKQAEDEAEAAAEEAADAGDETEKAKAEAKQAQAEADAAESNAEVAVGCARAYLSAFGALFEGDDPAEQAPTVREEIAGITDDCKAALAP